MTGLPIAEVVHSRGGVATSSHIALPAQRYIQSAISDLPSEPYISAVNLSSKYSLEMSSHSIPRMSSGKDNSGIDALPASRSSLGVLSEFQPSSSVTQKVIGTTVNPLLMPVRTLEAKPLNVSFPPTRHLLHASSSIPTQSVETTGLIQAGSPISGITSLNPDSLTIRITNVPTETTEQGI